MRNPAVTAMLLSGLLLAAPSAGTVAQPAADRPANGPVSVRSAAKPFSGFDRMPIVLAGRAVSASSAARINAAMHAVDVRGIDAATSCRSEVERGHEGGWTRTARPTMVGPTYFAVNVSDSYYCGGPYPNDDLRSDYVYDIATGRPVNWLTLFPSGARAVEGTAPDGSPLGLVAWPELARRAARDALPDCKDVLTPWTNVGFSIGLDGRSGELVAVPSGLPHVVQACAIEVRLNAFELSRLRFATRLAEALNGARNLQPKRVGQEKAR